MLNLFLKILEITVTKLNFKRLYSIEDNLELQYKKKERMLMIVMVIKRILLSCIIILSFLTESMTAFAATNTSQVSEQLLDIVEPMWDNTSSVEVNLSFDVSKAICGALVVGKVGTTKITGTVVLSKKNSNGTYK